MMRILITGVSGFIGSNLAKYLCGKKEYSVYGLVRPKSDISVLMSAPGKINIIRTSGSFESIDSAIRRSKPDVVIHLAALSLVEHSPGQVEELIGSNILFSTMLVEAMVKNGRTRLINTGSFWEYMEEQGKYNPCNLYAATKFSFEQILHYYENARNLKTVTLKLSGTYGPNDLRHKMFYFFKKALDSKKKVLFSPGKQKLDLVYIDDIMRAYEKAVGYICKKNNNTAKTFSVALGQAVELKEIARIYEECAGGKLNIKWGGLPYRAREMMECEVDILDTKNKLKWQPAIGLRKGIARMLKEESAG
ncbi:MAG: NAD(P)-dependent oxidoreductase [Candidatus Omnitrophota bacterium]|jgi:nucleoside-diphosphate-sugar epimerase